MKKTKEFEVTHKINFIELPSDILQTIISQLHIRDILVVLNVCKNLNLKCNDLVRLVNVLDLACFNIPPHILDFLSSFKHLECLKLGSAIIPDGMLKVISSLTNIRCLDLHVSIFSPLPNYEEISTLQNLTALIIMPNCLDLTLAKTISKFTLLTKLHITLQHINGSIDEKAIEHLTTLKNIKSFSLHSCVVMYPLPAMFFKYLGTLDLDTLTLGNFTCPSQPETFAPLSKLTNLRSLALLSLCSSMTCYHFMHLNNLTQIENLFLNGFWVQAPIIDYIEKLEKLRVLNLCATISDDQLKKILRPSLLILTINSPLLTIIPDLTNMPNLLNMEITTNSYAQIPNYIISLKNLKLLSINQQTYHEMVLNKDENTIKEWGKIDDTSILCNHVPSSLPKNLDE